MTILPIPAAAPLARVQHINITVLGPIHLKQTVLIEANGTSTPVGTAAWSLKTEHHIAGKLVRSF